MAKRKVSQKQPKRSRPAMPADYGIAKGTKGMMSWPVVEKKIAAAHNYWICTSRSDGRPHAMPVWGVWHEGAVYFATDATSTKARNVLANPAMAIHLELDREAVILEGKAERVADRGVLQRLDAPYARKYKMKVSTAPGEMFLVRLRPRVVLAWTEKQFGTTPTRFTFD